MLERVESCIEDIGTDYPKVGFVACTHGNERVGLYVHKYARSLQLSHGSLRLIVANVKAALENKRFIDRDLNSSFPGLGSDYESRLARGLIPYLKECEYLFDFHSTTATTPPFSIIRNHDGLAAEVVQSIGLKYAVIKSQLGQSSIDYAKVGIGLELGTHDTKLTIQRAMILAENILRNLKMLEGMSSPSRKTIFLNGDGIMQKPDEFVPNTHVLFNFNRISAGDLLGRAPSGLVLATEDFYPVLYGEQSYKGILCWKGIRIN